MRKSIHSHEHRRLAALLRTLRSETGLTQRELGARLDRPQSFVAKVEAGERRLDLVELRTYADALDTDLQEVVSRFEAALRRDEPPPA